MRGGVMSRIITISREFGSGGRAIGEEVAKRLGIAYYDKMIIEEVAKATGFAEDFIEKKGEYSPFKNPFAYAFVGRDSNGMSIDDYLYSVQRQTIMSLAEEGPCVIVGRCADDILSERDDCLNIFIHGNTEDKINRIMRRSNVSEKEAAKLMREMDKKRSINYKYHTEKQWGHANNYDACLNSTTLGADRCIELIIQLFKL